MDKAASQNKTANEILIPPGRPDNACATSVKYVGVSAKVYSNKNDEEYRHKIYVLNLSGKNKLNSGLLKKKCFLIHHDFNYTCFIIKDNEKSSIYDKTGFLYS